MRFRSCTRFSCFGLLFLGLSASLLSGSETVDPDNTGARHAWAENLGWINAEPSGDGGPGMRILDNLADGWLWAENIGWVNLSCRNNRTCGDVDFGVAVEPSGDLSGYVWSENVGWISLSCLNTDSCASVEYGVSVNLATGALRGFAWSENTGWISFSCANTASCASVDYGIETETPLPTEEIFADDFELGSTSRWSRTEP